MQNNPKNPKFARIKTKFNNKKNVIFIFNTVWLCFFCYLCNDFPHSLLDDCRFKRLFENKTAHAVLREAKSSDGVERGGQHRKSRKAIPPEVGSGE